MKNDRVHKIVVTGGGRRDFTSDMSACEHTDADTGAKQYQPPRVILVFHAGKAKRDGLNTGVIGVKHKYFDEISLNCAQKRSLHSLVKGFVKTGGFLFSIEQMELYSRRMKSHNGCVLAKFPCIHDVCMVL